MNLLEPYALSLHRCTICHVQCQFMNLELFASGRQALETSRKAMLIEAVLRGDLDWGPEVVEVVYAALNSGVQHEVCVNYGDPDGWPDETQYIRAARAEIVRAGKAPAWAEQIRRNWEHTGNPYGMTTAAEPAPGESLFYHDAADRAFEPRALRAWFHIASRLNVKERIGQAAVGSSGFELFDLGYLDEARQAAARLQGELSRLNPQQIVCNSPEAAYMMTQVWPSWGFTPPAPVIHTSQWLEKALADHPGFNTGGLPVTVLDASCLGRYLGVTEAPRRVLRKLGVPMVEFVRNRQEAPPSGSYFGVQPGLWMSRVAEDVRSQATAAGAWKIVTTSPFDTRNLGLGSRFPIFVNPLWQVAQYLLDPIFSDDSA